MPLRWKMPRTTTIATYTPTGPAQVCADRSREAAEAAAAHIVSGGGRALAVTADVTSEADCSAMVAAAEKKFGAVHVLFNNAGVMLSADDDAVNTSEACLSPQSSRLLPTVSSTDKTVGASPNDRPA